MHFHLRLQNCIQSCRQHKTHKMSHLSECPTEISSSSCAWLTYSTNPLCFGIQGEAASNSSDEHWAINCARTFIRCVWNFGLLSTWQVTALNLLHDSTHFQKYEVRIAGFIDRAVLCNVIKCNTISHDTMYRAGEWQTFRADNIWHPRHMSWGD